MDLGTTTGKNLVLVVSLDMVVQNYKNEMEVGPHHYPRVLV